MTQQRTLPSTPTCLCSVPMRDYLLKPRAAGQLLVESTGFSAPTECDLRRLREHIVIGNHTLGSGRGGTAVRAERRRFRERSIEHHLLEEPFDDPHVEAHQMHFKMGTL